MKGVIEMMVSTLMQVGDMGVLTVPDELLEQGKVEPYYCVRYEEDGTLVFYPLGPFLREQQSAL